MPQLSRITLGWRWVSMGLLQGFVLILGWTSLAAQTPPATKPTTPAPTAPKPTPPNSTAQTKPAPTQATKPSPSAPTAPAATQPAPPPKPFEVIHQLKGHGELVYSVAISPDGKWLASGSFDKTVRLWDLASGKLIKTFGGAAGHQNQVLSVQFSPDQRVLASSGSDNVIKFWDIPVQGALRSFVGHGAEINAVAVSPDGTKLATASNDQSLRLWSIADGKALPVCNGHVGPVLAIAFSPNSQQLVSVGQDLTLRLWNVADGQPLAVAGAHAAPINSVAITPNGQQAVTASQDGWLKVWQLPLQPSRLLHPPHQGPVQSLALSADGKYLASGSTDKTVRIINLANGNTERVITAPSEISWVGWSQSSPLLITGHAGQRFHFWNPADGASWGSLVSNGDPITAQTMDAKGTFLLTGNNSGQLKIWQWDLPRIQAPLPVVQQADGIAASVLALDGKVILTGGADKIIRRWNPLANKSQPEAQYNGMEAAITALAIRPDSQRLVSGGADGFLSVWDDKQPVIMARLGMHLQAISSITLVPNLDELITASLDGTVKRWRLPTVAQQLTHPQLVQQMWLNADGSAALTLAADQHIRLWNLANGQIEKGYPLAAPNAKGLSLHAASGLFAWFAADKTLHLHSLVDGKEQKNLGPLAFDPVALAFSPDGKTLAVAGADHIIRLITWNDGKEIRALSGHTGLVQKIVFHPSQPRLVSQSVDQQLIVWNLTDGQVIGKIAHPATVLDSCLSTDGGTLASLAQDKIIRLWNPIDAKPAGQFNSPGDARSLVSTANGQRFLLSGDGRSWIIERNGQVVEVLRHQGPALHPSFHPDGLRLLWCQQQSVAIDRQHLLWSENFGKPIRALYWLPKTDYVVAVGDDQQVRLIQAKDGKTHKVLLGHAGPIAAVASDATGQFLVTAGADKKAILWNLADSKPKRAWTLPQPIVQLAMAPNGQRIAMGLANHVVQVADVASGEMLQQWSDHTGPITSLYLLADQRTILSTSMDKTLRYHDVAVSKVISNAHKGAVTALMIHPNGTQAFSAGADKLVKWWDLNTGKIIREWPALPEAITAMALSREANPTRLAVASGDKVVRLLNLADGKELLKLTLPGPALTLDFSPDSTRLLTAGNYPKAQVWDASSGHELQFFPVSGAITAARFHPDGKQLIWGGTEKVISISPVALVKAMQPHGAALRDLVILPNGTHVITAGEDGTARLVNLASGQVEKTMGGHKGPIVSLDISRAAISVVTAGADQTIRFFNLADGKEIKSLQHSAPITRLALSPNHATLAVTGADQQVVVYHVPFVPGQPLASDFGKVLSTFKHDGPTRAVAFMADSTSLFSGSADKTVRLWKFSQETPTRNLAGHANLVDGLAFSPDSTTLASCSHDGTVRLWKVADGSAIASIPAFTAPVYCVSFSADGKYLLAGSFARSMKWIDVASKSAVLELNDLYDRAFPTGPYDGPFAHVFAKAFTQGHRDGIFSAQIFPDGKTVVSAGSDGQIKIWNLSDSSVQRHLVDPQIHKDNNPIQRAHQDWINQIRFTPDHTRLVSVGHAGWLKLWHWADGKLLFAEKFPSGIYAVAFTPDGKLAALAHQDGSISICRMP